MTEARLLRSPPVSGAPQEADSPIWYCLCGRWASFSSIFF